MNMTQSSKATCDISMAFISSRLMVGVLVFDGARLAFRVFIAPWRVEVDHRVALGHRANRRIAGADFDNLLKALVTPLFRPGCADFLRGLQDLFRPACHQLHLLFLEEEWQRRRRR